MILLEETSLTLDLDSTRHGGKQLAAEHLEEDRDIRGIHVQGGGDRVEVRLGRGGVVHLGSSIRTPSGRRGRGFVEGPDAMAAAPLAVGGSGSMGQSRIPDAEGADPDEEGPPTVVFTDFELEYLRSQRLGRLATLSPRGTLQNSPVGFQVDEEAGVIAIWGRTWATPASSTTWPPTVRRPSCRRPGLGEPLGGARLEIRGSAEALSGRRAERVLERRGDPHPPRRIITWGVGPEGMRASRAVPAD